MSSWGDDERAQWEAFVGWSTPNPISGGSFYEQPLTTEERGKLNWAIRNVRPSATKTIEEMRAEGAIICDAAVSYLARSAMTRNEAAIVERSNGDPYGPLLNLPVGNFVQYVQKDLVMQGYAEDHPV